MVLTGTDGAAGATGIKEEIKVMVLLELMVLMDLTV
jgi:hypothetical protein